ncbi:HK97 gp10 family phage protein [Nonomuraea sp. NBC_00507]|uniref:hypothetical protein n=1 Tax=Nonomuraea sp. NBC_00507 TaxID=2976002 RepID=UPI002E18DA56
MSVRVSIDTAALRGMAYRPDSPLVAALHRKVRLVETRAKQLAPVDTGRLRSSIHTQGPTPGPTGARFEVVAPVAYAMWVHKGWREYRRGTGRIVRASAGPRPFLLEALLQVFG